MIRNFASRLRDECEPKLRGEVSFRRNRSSILYIYIYTGEDERNKAAPDWRSCPLWKDLPAGNVYTGAAEPMCARYNFEGKDLSPTFSLFLFVFVQKRKVVNRRRYAQADKPDAADGLALYNCIRIHIYSRGESRWGGSGSRKTKAKDLWTASAPIDRRGYSPFISADFFFLQSYIPREERRVEQFTVAIADAALRSFFAQLVRFAPQV